MCAVIPAGATAGCCAVPELKVGCSYDNFDGNTMSEAEFDDYCDPAPTCGASALSVSFVAVLAFLVAFKELF